jgi:chromosome segregation ATPase
MSQPKKAGAFYRQLQKQHRHQTPNQRLSTLQRQKADITKRNKPKERNASYVSAERSPRSSTAFSPAPYFVVREAVADHQKMVHTIEQRVLQLEQDQAPKTPSITVGEMANMLQAYEEQVLQRTQLQSQALQQQALNSVFSTDIFTNLLQQFESLKARWDDFFGGTAQQQRSLDVLTQTTQEQTQCDIQNLRQELNSQLTQSQLDTQTQLTQLTQLMKDAQTQAQVQSQIDTQTQTQAQAQFQAQLDTQTQFQSQLQAQLQSQIDTQTQAQSQLQAQLQSQLDTQTQVQSQCQAQIDTQTQFQSRFQAQLDTQTQEQAQIQAQFQEQIQAQTQEQLRQFAAELVMHATKFRECCQGAEQVHQDIFQKIDGLNAQLQRHAQISAQVDDIRQLYQGLVDRQNDQILPQYSELHDKVLRLQSEAVAEKDVQILRDTLQSLKSQCGEQYDHHSQHIAVTQAKLQEVDDKHQVMQNNLSVLRDTLMSTTTTLQGVQNTQDAVNLSVNLTLDQFNNRSKNQDAELSRIDKCATELQFSLAAVLVDVKHLFGELQQSLSGQKMLAQNTATSDEKLSRLEAELKQNDVYMRDIHQEFETKMQQLHEQHEKMNIIAKTTQQENITMHQQHTAELAHLAQTTQEHHLITQQLKSQQEQHGDGVARLDLAVQQLHNHRATDQQTAHNQTLALEQKIEQKMNQQHQQYREHLDTIQRSVGDHASKLQELITSYEACQRFVADISAQVKDIKDQQQVLTSQAPGYDKKIESLQKRYQQLHAIMVSNMEETERLNVNITEVIDYHKKMDQQYREAATLYENRQNEYVSALHDKDMQLKTLEADVKKQLEQMESRITTMQAPTDNIQNSRLSSRIEELAQPKYVTPKKV